MTRTLGHFTGLPVPISPKIFRSPTEGFWVKFLPFNFLHSLNEGNEFAPTLLALLS